MKKIEKEEYLERIKDTANAILEAGKANLSDNLSAAVPSCSEWNLAQLIEHQADVFVFCGNTVKAAAEEPSGGRSPLSEDAKGEEVLASFEESRDLLLGALKAAEFEDTAWNWTADPNKAHFWFRRMVHESTIHAVDAKSAINESFEISEKWGVDGADEYLTSFLPFRISNLSDEEKPTGSFHLHSLEGGEWFCAEKDGEVSITREHQKGDAALKGSGGDLMLAVWKRIELDSNKLELIGDKEIARKWMSFAP